MKKLILLALLLATFVIPFVYVRSINSDFFSYKQVRFPSYPQYSRIWHHAWQKQVFRGGWKFQNEEALEVHDDISFLVSPALVDEIGDFKGVEIDIMWSSKFKDFLVSHDKKGSLKTFETIAGKAIKLRDLLLMNQKYPQIHYWLDLKNLRYISLIDAIKRLEELFEEFDLKNRAFIESYYPHQLKELAKAGFNTSLWLRSSFVPQKILWNPKNSSFINLIRLPLAFYHLARLYWRELKQRKNVSSGHFKAVSIGLDQYNVFRKSYKHLNVFTWSNSTEKTMREKNEFGYSEINIFLVD